MLYSDVIKQGYILPKKQKYTMIEENKMLNWLWECNASLLDLSSSILEGQPMSHLIAKAKIAKEILQSIPNHKK